MARLGRHISGSSPGPTILTVISYSIAHGRRANVPLVVLTMTKGHGQWPTYVSCTDGSSPATDTDRTCVPGSLSRAFSCLDYQLMIGRRAMTRRRKKL